MALGRGAPLYAEGAPAPLLYVVARGAVETYVRRAGEKRRLGIAGPGRVVGEVAFVGDRPHATDAAAKENAILLTLERAALDDLMAQRAPLALRLLDAIGLESTATLLGAGRRHVKLLAERAEA